MNVSDWAIGNLTGQANSSRTDLNMIFKNNIKCTLTRKYKLDNMNNWQVLEVNMSAVCYLAKSLVRNVNNIIKWR